MNPTHIASTGELATYDRDQQYLWDAPHWSLQLRHVAVEPLPADATHWTPGGVILRNADEWCCGMWIPSGVEYDDRIALG